MPNSRGAEQSGHVKRPEVVIIRQRGANLEKEMAALEDELNQVAADILGAMRDTNGEPNTEKAAQEVLRRQAR